MRATTHWRSLRSIVQSCRPIWSRSCRVDIVATRHIQEDATLLTPFFLHRLDKDVSLLHDPDLVSEDLPLQTSARIHRNRAKKSSYISWGLGATATIAEKNEQDKTLALQRYARELELRALDALLAGDKKAEDLVESAEQAYSDGRVLVFLRALADVNAGNEPRAIEELERLKESGSEFTVAAHATLTFAYVHSGRLNDFLKEMEELKGRTPVSHEDRLMLANALLWVDAERGLRLAREAIATHASPVA